VGVNAVEITDAVQVVGPPRWSEMVIAPSEPDITLEVVDATCDPREIPAVGALIERVPVVRVKEAGVEAPAGKATPIVTAPSAVTKKTDFCSFTTPHLVIESRAKRRHH